LQLLKKLTFSNKYGDQNNKLDLTPFHPADLDLQVFKIIKKQRSKRRANCADLDAPKAPESEHHSLPKSQVSNQWYI